MARVLSDKELGLVGTPTPEARILSSEQLGLGPSPADQPASGFSRTSSPDDIPEVPEPSDPAYQQQLERSRQRPSSEGPIDQYGGLGALMPVAAPAFDFMAGFNRVPGQLADLALSPVRAAQQLAGSEPVGKVQDIPFIQEATTGGFHPASDVLSTAGEFAGFGGATNIIAKEATKHSGTIVRGTDSVMRGILKDVSRTPLKTDVALGAASGAGAQVGGDIGGPPGELLGSILAPLATLGPRMVATAAERRAAQIAQGRAEDPGQALIRLSDRGATKLTPSEGRKPPLTQEQLIREPVPLTAVERTDDPGLFSLARDLASTNAKLDGEIDAAFRATQKSLTDEMSSILGPNGEVDPAALSALLAKERANLIGMQTERIDQAVQSMLNSAKIGVDKDPVKISRRFRTALEESFRAVNEQNNKLWGIVNREVSIDTIPLKRSAEELVKSADKNARLPIKALEAILGRRVVKTDSGWAVSDVKVKGGLKDQDRASELLTMRSNIMEDIRSQSAGTITAPKSIPLMQKLQSDIINSLDSATLSDESFRGAYDTARAFTREMHRVFDQGQVGKVLMGGETGERVLPEATLKALFGADRETQAAASRELSALLTLRGEAPAQSRVLKDVQDYWASRFQEEVTDVASAQKFMVENQHVLERFPALRQRLQQATSEIFEQGTVKTAAEAQRDVIGEARIYNLIGMNGKQVVSTVLKEQDPRRAAQEVHRRLRSDPAAMSTMRRDIASYMLERAQTSSRVLGLDEQLSKAGMVKGMRELGPLISQFYTPSQRQRLQLILEDVATATAFRETRGKALPPSRNILFDFAGRMAGTGAAASLSPGSSIVLQTGAARVMRTITDAMTDAQVRTVLEQAVLDERVMRILLQKDLTAKNATRLRELIPQLGAEGHNLLQQAVDPPADQ